jgi:hypothetical protein
METIIFNAYDLHTVMLNNNDPEIHLVALSYHNGEKIHLQIVLDDITFLEFISHREIDQIKENIKNRIDQL